MIAIDEALSSRKFGIHFTDKATIISTFTDCLVAPASHIGTSNEWKIMATIEKKQKKNIYKSSYFVAMLCYYWI